MIGIIVATHGNLCYGLKDTYEMVAGVIPKNVSFVSLARDIDVSKFKELFKECIHSTEKYDGILVLVDLEGGSPYNVASEYFYNEEYANKISIVSGINFSALVEAIEDAEDMDLEKLTQEVIKNGTEGIKRVQQIENIEEEEEF